MSSLLENVISQILYEIYDPKMKWIGFILGSKKQIDKDTDEVIEDPILSDIKGMGFEPFTVFYFGKIGYLIPNIPKRDIIEFGKKHKKGIAWSTKVEDGISSHWHWQYLEDGKIRGQNTSRHPYIVPKF